MRQARFLIEPANLALAVELHHPERTARTVQSHGGGRTVLAVLSGQPLDPGLSSPEEFRDTVGRYEEVGVTDFVVHWPRPSEPYAADLAMFEEIFEVVQ